MTPYGKKGDSKFLSIAAASIIAKDFRDRLMMRYSNKYIQYGWEKNKGYPTLMHKNAILKYGITKLHRTSYKLGTEKVLSETLL